VESLRLSGGLPEDHSDPGIALDYSCLEAARSETRGRTGA
jgi:hypothetical protein